jgi:small GTP-binding protein
MGCDMSFLKKVKMGKDGNTTIDGESYEKRILLLGLDNAGKTSILFQMRDNQFKATVPTVGLNIEHITHKRYSMTFWDVGGQATKLWKHYFDKIDAVIFVIDSTDEEKLLFAKEEFNRLLTDESLLGVPFLILYNKSDVVDRAKS